MTESRFFIDPGVSTNPAEEHSVANYAVLLDERQRADIEAYNQLLATLKNSGGALEDHAAYDYWIEWR